jgi:hypothetical protein
VLLENMWKLDPTKRWDINKVLEYLKRPDMWDKSTVEEFQHYPEWMSKQPVTEVLQQRVAQPSEVMDLEAILPDPDPTLGLSGYITNVIAMFTVNGDRMNMDVRQNVLGQLRSSKTLDRDWHYRGIIPPHEPDYPGITRILP